MKAIIPVAGSGTRLRPLTHSKPKALLRVGSKPILAHIIEGLIGIGCTDLILIISSNGGKIPLYVRERYPDVRVETVIQEEQLGLGHAVSLTANLARDSEIIIVYGDTIIEGGLAGIVDRSCDGVIAVKEVADPRRFGVVYLENGMISRFVEKPSKPESNLAIVGLNYIKNSTALFDLLAELIASRRKTRGEYQITDAFQLMVEHGLRLKPHTVEGWFDAGTQETLLETNSYMLKRDANCESLPGSVIIPPVYIPDSAAITHSIIGPDVSVGDNAVIERSIISDSIIGSGARISNACFTRSLIGDDAEVIERPGKIIIGDNSSIDLE